jgi:exopolysaccharide production protein ExoQ
MTTLIATITYVAGIIWLFYLAHDAKARTSKALWIPVIWLLIIGSRPVSAWLNAGPTMSQEEGYAEGNPFDAMVFGVLIAAGVAILVRRSSQVGRFLRGNAPLLLYFAYCALSIGWSDQSFVAFKRWIKAVGDLVMILIVLTDPNPVAAMKRLFSRVGFVLLPLSVLFIKYYPKIGRSFSKSWIPMFGGVTTQKNSLGLLCLVCGLGSLWSFVGTYEDRTMPHRVRHLVAHGIILATAIWLFKTSDSMTSFSCFLMAGAVMVLTTRRYVIKRPRVVLALISGCIGLSLFALFADETGLLVHALGRNTTLTGRTLVWQAVLSMHTNPWLGTGFQSFWAGSRLERVGEMTEQGIMEAHNGYLELYLNLGFGGIALLAVLIVSGYRNVLAAFRRDPHAGGLLLAFFTAVLIYNLTEAGFTLMTPTWIAFLLAVTFVPPSLRHKKREQEATWPLIGSCSEDKSELLTGSTYQLQWDELQSSPSPLEEGDPCSARMALAESVRGSCHEGG